MLRALLVLATSLGVAGLSSQLPSPLLAAASAPAAASSQDAATSAPPADAESGQADAQLLRRQSAAATAAADVLDPSNITGAPPLLPARAPPNRTDAVVVQRTTAQPPDARPAASPAASPPPPPPTIVVVQIVNIDECRTGIDQRLEDVFGWIGFLASLFLFASPVYVMRSVLERGYIESFSALPYVLAAANAGMWVVYGLPEITRCNTKVIVANAVGVVLELTYVGIFLKHAGPRRRHIALQLGLVCFVVFLMILLGTVVAANIHFTPWPHRTPPISRQATVLGFFNFFTTVAMFGSPLIAVSDVVRSKSVEYMPISLTIGTFVCAIMWFAYGLAADDLFIIVPNGIGAGLGLVQLGVYSWYNQWQATPMFEPWRMERAKLGEPPHLSTAETRRGFQQTCGGCCAKPEVKGM